MPARTGQPEKSGELRESAGGRRGAAASAHPLATQSGLEVLKAGGNAFDAAIAMNAVLQVVQPGMCGMGGDFFCLIYEARTGRVRCLNGSGPTASRLTRESIQGGKIPLRHGLAVSVPGCVDAWRLLNGELGTAPLSRLFSAAVDLCRHGFALTRNSEHWLKRESDALLRASSPLRNRFYPGGRPLRAGTWLRQLELAETFERIGESEGREFYQGSLARRIFEAIQKEGGILSLDDIAGCRAEWQDPISLRFDDSEIFVPSPNSQGVALLIMLKLLQKESGAGVATQGYRQIRSMVGAKEIAFAVRDFEVGDPRFMRLSAGELLEEKRLKGWVEKMGARANPAERRLPGLGDTTAFSVVDVDGNIVCAVQSLYTFFGSRIEVEGTGLILHNRGAYLHPSKRAVNCIGPGKRPLHTLMCSLALRGNRPHLALGTMGGDGQPQTQLQILWRVVREAWDLQRAIDAPRWIHGVMERDQSDELQMEGRFPPIVLKKLSQSGYRVRRLPGWSQDVGHAHGLQYDPRGKLWRAAGDLRCGGIGLAY